MIKKTQQKIADEIGLSRRTIAEYKSAGVDIQSPKAIAERILASRKPPEQALAWASQILTNGKPAESGEFTGADDLESLRDHYQQETAQAIIRGDIVQIKYWNELLLKTDESLRRTELHKRKLGLEEGETLARAEVERILEAVIYAGNACIRKQLKEVCEVIAECKTPNDVYNILPAIMLGGKIFEGFRQLIADERRGESKVSLPKWLVDCVNKAGQNYFEECDLFAESQP